MTDCLPDCRPDPLAGSAADGAVVLSEARIEETHWIVAVNAGGELRERLISMGLHRGVAVRVVMRGQDGAHLIAIANARLGLDGAMSRAVQVRRSGIGSARGAGAMGSGSHPFAFRQRHGSMSSEPAPEPASSPAPDSQQRLQDLPAGCRARVLGYRQGSRSYRQKLLAMGLTPGTDVEVTRHAPMGDPVELKVRGFSLILRKQEADMLFVSVSPHG